MKKNNPFYYFLKKYQKSLIKLSKDSHGDNFLTLSLNQPSAQLEFNYEGTCLSFIEHHVTVYQEINDHVGFKSAYHYTLCFESHVIHVYFKENGTFISATLENNEQQSIKILSDFFDEGLFFVHSLLENEVKPLLLNLFEQHLILLNEHKTQYISELSKVKDSLFDGPEAIQHNLTMLQKIISKGEALALLSYSQNFVKETLSFLKGCESTIVRLIQTPLVLGKKKGPVATPVDVETTLEEIIVPNIASMQALRGKKPSTKSSLYSFTEDAQAFEIAYQEFNEQWSLMKISEEDLPLKLQKFSQISQDFLINLNTKTVILLSQTKILESANQALFRRANLEVNLFNEQVKQMGVSLLLASLPSSSLLEQYQSIFAELVAFLNHHHLEEVMRRGNVAAVKFLIENGSFNLNDIRVRVNAKGLKLSPLCAAYKLNNVELFELLLNHNASTTTFYQDMPLAHVIMQLEVTNPFYQSFMVHNDKAINGNPRFYKFLCKAIDSKLASLQLTENEICELQTAKSKYQRCIDGHISNLKISRSTRESMFATMRHLNPSVVQEMKATPTIDFIMLTERLNIKSKQFHQLLSQQHLSHTFMKHCDKVYKNAKRTLEECDDGVLQHWTQEDFIDNLQVQLHNIEALIDFFSLRTKNIRTKDEELRLKKAQEFLKKSVDIENQSHRDSKAFLEFKTKLTTLQEICASLSNLLTDKYQDVDFLAAAQEQGDNLGKSAQNNFFSPNPPSSSSRKDSIDSRSFLKEEATPGSDEQDYLSPR